MSGSACESYCVAWRYQGQNAPATPRLVGLAYPLLQPDSSSVGTLIKHEQLSLLPHGREAFSLAMDPLDGRVTNISGCKSFPLSVGHAQQHCDLSLHNTPEQTVPGSQSSCAPLPLQDAARGLDAVCLRGIWTC